VDYNYNGTDQKVKNNYSKFNKNDPMQRQFVKPFKGIQADGILGIGAKVEYRNNVHCVWSEKDKGLEFSKWKENESA